MSNGWKNGIFGCSDDWETCCYGFCCTSCLFGSNAEKIDGTNCCLMCCLYCVLANCYLCWIPHCMKREKLRAKYNLKEDPCHDCPTTCFCGPCALCQEAREMEARDFGGRPGYPGRPISMRPAYVKGEQPVVQEPGAQKSIEEKF